MGDPSGFGGSKCLTLLPFRVSLHGRAGKVIGVGPAAVRPGQRDSPRRCHHFAGRGVSLISEGLDDARPGAAGAGLLRAVSAGARAVAASATTARARKTGEKRSWARG